MYYQNLCNILAKQKHDLGMSEAYIAEHSGVSQPTVHRILSGKHEKAAWNDIVEIAEVLGIKACINQKSVHDMREEQAQKIAERLVNIMLATSQLEGQGISKDKKNQMIAHQKIKLLAGSSRKLWMEE